MTLDEQIEVMQHFAAGGEVEGAVIAVRCTWYPLKDPNWNWDDYNYRIKETPVDDTLYEWLVKRPNGSWGVADTLRTEEEALELWVGQPIRKTDRSWKLEELECTNT